MIPLFQFIVSRKNHLRTLDCKSQTLNNLRTCISITRAKFSDNFQDWKSSLQNVPSQNKQSPQLSKRHKQ